MLKKGTLRMLDSEDEKIYTALKKKLEKMTVDERIEYLNKLGFDVKKQDKLNNVEREK